MRSLACACVVRTPPKTGFLATRPILYTSFINQQLTQWSQYNPLSGNGPFSIQKPTERPGPEIIKLFHPQLSMNFRLLIETKML